MADGDDDLDVGVALGEQGPRVLLHDDLLLLAARHDQRERELRPVEGAGRVALGVGLTAVPRVARAVVVGREPPRVHLPQQGRDGDGREDDGDEHEQDGHDQGTTPGVWSSWTRR